MDGDDRLKNSVDVRLVPPPSSNIFSPLPSLHQNGKEDDGAFYCTRQIWGDIEHYHHIVDDTQDNETDDGPDKAALPP